MSIVHDDQRRAAEKPIVQRLCLLRVLCVRRLGSRSCHRVIAALRATSEPLPQDTGAAGTWQRLLKLQTTASVDAHDGASGR